MYEKRLAEVTTQNTEMANTILMISKVLCLNVTLLYRFRVLCIN